MNTKTLPAYTVSKSSVELYKLRQPDGFGWADITIDAHGEAGRISIASDYGDWQNYWGYCGCPFKEFLGKINAHYAAKKFGAAKWLDTEKTIKGFRVELLRSRREDSIAADEARIIYGQIKELAEESTPESLSHDIRLHEELVDWLIEGGGPDFHYGIEPAFQRLWDEIWPALLAEFTHERELVAA